MYTSLQYVVAVAIVLCCTISAASSQNRSGWKTDWDNTSIDVSEILSGGVPRDGIPPIDNPKYVSIADARRWIGGREPVIQVVIDNDARAFPLQILTYHEIVNAIVGGRPIAVTFCPLCYSSIAFDRELDSVVYDFGVSGLLRFSDMIMYDRQTESLWQQVTGQAIVGDMNGRSLNVIPTQLISFEQFASRHPDGKVLSKETGHVRNYGTNPYVGYDDITDRPFLYTGELDDRLPPMERVVAVELGGLTKAYPFRTTRKRRVVNDNVGGQDIVVFHVKGAVSALDKANISRSEAIGSTGVFSRVVDDTLLSFSFVDKNITDAETGSTWDITGFATSGKLEGTQLEPVVHGNYFSFAWFAFKPATQIYSE